ncbi:MAG: lysophospholipid acyltransferase family protein [Phycisphaerae bacterium]|nr:lysophospholipid acyltransferase family protein [Phycisphaerae bacterium]
MKRDDGITAWLAYVLVRVICMILLMFPLEWNLRTARLLGTFWWHLTPRHRERARRHLRTALGDSLSPTEIDRLALRCLQQQAMWVMEFVFTPRLINEWTWRKYIRLVNMNESLSLLLQNKGALLLTGHYGNWELSGFLLAVLGFDVVAIMRPLDNVYLNRFLVETRRRSGLQLLYKKGAITEAESILRSGAALGFIADQDAGSKGLFVDFFGCQASTYKSIGLLAMAREVPIIVGYARRVGNSFRYEVGAQRVIHPHQWRDQEDPLRWITQEYTAAIEELIRVEPSQYLWIHRRWKSRPRPKRRRAIVGRVPPADQT